MLLLYSIPFLIIRTLCKSINRWSPEFDRIGLMVLSLTLFLNASFKSFIVFLFEIIFNYLMVRLMLRQKGNSAKIFATLVIVFDIAILAYFKYLTFFVEDVVGLAIPGGLSENWQAGFPLPVFDQIPPGVSFYTFQMVSFVVESLKQTKRKRKPKPIAFIDYVNFVAFFPQIVAGPIERRSDLFPQLQKFEFQFNADNIEAGLRWFSLGLFMKMVLADNLFPFIDVEQATNPWLVWLYAFLFTLRIYFDFAGYSFMALGIARTMGVKLTINFLSPYTSTSIQEFWRRWHITLSTWFRDYVFIPLMGTNKKWATSYLFITFTLSGFWHGAAWNFIIWGAYHGALLLLLRYAGRPFQRMMGNKSGGGSRFFSWALTFGSIILGCLFFMDTNISRLVTKLQTIINPTAYSLGNLTGAFSDFTVNEIAALTLTLGLSLGWLLIEHIEVWQKRPEYELLRNPWVSPLLLGLTLLLAANQPSEFIYFEF
ncbi:MAG: MBOAT family O-acyltransferase [Spirulinaceae cyanobacterium]